LAASDVFYFGNAVGETGDLPGDTLVDRWDAPIRSSATLGIGRSRDRSAQEHDTIAGYGRVRCNTRRQYDADHLREPPFFGADGRSSLGEPRANDPFFCRQLLPRHLERSIVSYEWDFDYDGVTFTVDATGMNVVRAYAQSGEYVVALRVTDDNEPAQTDLATVPVTVAWSSIRGIV
jgi:hypothetical protein